MSEHAYIVRVDYIPKEGGGYMVPMHRAIVRIAPWNMMARCKKMVSHLASDIHDISIDGVAVQYNGDFLIAAGPVPEQP